MSLQDKISSAKPTTFLTDGLSEEEVKQAVEEGRRRSMKLIIDIPKERLDSIKHFGIKQNEVSMLERAIVNGIPLDDVKAEIRAEQEKYSHPLEIERAIEILDNIGKESEDKE